MNNKQKIVALFVAFTVLFWVSEAPALEYLDGKLNIHGFIQSQIRLHVAGKNPNNEDFHCNPRNKNDINMLRSMTQLEISYDLSSQWVWWAKVRAINESSRWDKQVRSFEAHPKN